MEQRRDDSIDLEIQTLKSIIGAASVSLESARALFDDTGLQADDFGKPECRSICSAILALLKEGRVPDALNLLQLVGSQAPRDLVVDVVVNSSFADATGRAEQVRTEGQRRKMLSALSVIARGLKNREVSLAESVSEAQKLLSGFVASSGARSSEEDLMGLLDTIDQLQLGRREPILGSGIDALDFMTGGLQKTLTIVGALPGVGKSALFAGIIKNLINKGTRVGLLSLEDSREWVTRRLVADASGVPLFVIGKKAIVSYQHERILEASPDISRALKNLIIDDTTGMTVPQVLASARRMIALGCQAILVDHLGEIRLERSERHDLDITHALQELRSIAKTYKVPVLVACHLKRRQGLSPETSPELTDFAFSSGVERMARVALGLFREDKGASLGISLLKQTEGPSGLDFKLNVNRTAGVVVQTHVSLALQEEMKWRDQ